MTLVLTLTVALLVGSGVYLLLGRRVFSAILGLSLLAHAANLVMLAAGGWGAKAPIVTVAADPDLLADPVPQAFVLTAIVISMTVTLYLLAVWVKNSRLLGRDEIVRPLASDADRPEAEVAAELAGESDNP